MVEAPLGVAHEGDFAKHPLGHRPLAISPMVDHRADIINNGFLANHSRLTVNGSGLLRKPRWGWTLHRLVDFFHLDIQRIFCVMFFLIIHIGNNLR